jgi:hypothetical protein
MMATPPENPTADYEVGYGRPPRHTQFKPGQSGNPKGRPKGQPTASEILMREAARVVRMRVGNKLETISKLEGVFRTLFNMALNGDPRAIGVIVTSYARLSDGTGETSREEADEKVLGAIVPDDEALRRMLARFDHLRQDEASQQ